MITHINLHKTSSPKTIKKMAAFNGQKDNQVLSDYNSHTISHTMMKSNSSKKVMMKMKKKQKRDGLRDSLHKNRLGGNYDPLAQKGGSAYNSDSQTSVTVKGLHRTVPQSPHA